jgi:hypothetical protein
MEIIINYHKIHQNKVVERRKFKINLILNHLFFCNLFYLYRELINGEL